MKKYSVLNYSKYVKNRKDTIPEESFILYFQNEVLPTILLNHSPAQNVEDYFEDIIDMYNLSLKEEE